MNTNITIDGRSLTLLATVESPMFTQDTWRDPAQPVNDPFAVGVVMLVRPRLALATVNPFIPWGGLYGIAWEVEPPRDPVARFQEAHRQACLRAEERMTGDRGLAPLPRQ